MALIKRCCCCSLKTGTKLIGFMQFIVGLILSLLVFVQLALMLYLREVAINETVENKVRQHYALKGVNMTELEREEEEAVAKVAFAYIVIAMMALFVYLLFSTLMGALLLVGVYKGKLNYVKWWIKIKTGLVLMAVGFILLQLMLLLFGLDADLTVSILSLVYDSCLILVVNSYYDEESDTACNADFTPGDNFNNGLPPPAYC